MALLERMGVHAAGGSPAPLDADRRRQIAAAPSPRIPLCRGHARPRLRLRPGRKFPPRSCRPRQRPEVAVPGALGPQHRRPPGRRRSPFRGGSRSSSRAVPFRLPHAGRARRPLVPALLRRSAAQHVELLAFASRPGGQAADRCPLCQMPGSAPCLPTLESTALARIHEDFPGWQPESGICVRCAELYAA